MLKELMQKKADLEQEMKSLYEKHISPVQEQISAINIDIEHMLAGKLADLRKLQAKEFGAINLTFDGYKVTETVPKKVEWDQQKLNDLFDRIAGAGDDPRAYMKVELKIGEKEYKEFVPEVKALFAEARTVKPGKATIAFQEVVDA
jgi:hypothetical protein